MNNARRKTIADVANRLSALETEINDFRNEVEPVEAEEREAFDNLSEGLQQSERGQQSEAAADALQEALDALESAVDSIVEAVGALETAAE